MVRGNKGTAAMTLRAVCVVPRVLLALKTGRHIDKIK